VRNTYNIKEEKEEEEEEEEVALRSPLSSSPS
jgi:hypothetical protein